MEENYLFAFHHHSVDKIAEVVHVREEDLKRFKSLFDSKTFLQLNELASIHPLNKMISLLPKYPTSNDLQKFYEHTGLSVMYERYNNLHRDYIDRYGMYPDPTCKKQVPISGKYRESIEGYKERKDITIIHKVPNEYFSPYGERVESPSIQHSLPVSLKLFCWQKIDQLVERDGMKVSNVQKFSFIKDYEKQTFIIIHRQRHRDYERRYECDLTPEYQACEITELKVSDDGLTQKMERV